MSTWYKNQDGHLFNLEKFLYIKQRVNTLIGYFQDSDEDGIRDFIVFDELECIEDAELCMKKIEEMLGSEQPFI